MEKLQLEFVNNSAAKALKKLPKEIGLQFGVDLQRVQEGKNPLSDFKHLTGIGPGVIADSDVKPAAIPIKDRPPFRFEAGHRSNQRPASFRH